MAEKLVGAGVALLGVLIGLGATQFQGRDVYTGVGADFLPMLVAILLLACGLALLKQAFSATGLKQLPEELSSLPKPHWLGMVLLSVGLLLNALLITRIGFVLSCAVLFVLAVRGLSLSMGQGWGRPVDWLRNALMGMAISAPVYWMFTKLLGLTLPGVTDTGWI